MTQFRLTRSPNSAEGEGPKHQTSMADQNTESDDNTSRLAQSTGDQATKESSQGTDKDLDDLLDAALEDFDKNAPQTAAKAEQADKQEAASAEVPVPDPDQLLEEIFNDDFVNNQRQFEDAMKHMLGEDSDLVQHFEQLAKMAGQVDGTDESQKVFSDTLQKTLGSLAQNTENLEGELSEDELMKMMSGLGLPGGGASESDEDGFMGAMQGMMKSLLSKDILYPSLKEISSKYPDWLSQHKSKLSADDYNRYEKQYSLMTKVCQEFEGTATQDTEDKKKQSFEKILDLMQQMQDCGQPPSDIVGEMVPGLEVDEHGNPKLPGVGEQCSVM